MSESADALFSAMHAALDCAFGNDPLTSVILVRTFRKGDPIAISEPVTDLTPRAADDICLVKLNVGPGNPGPVGAPSTSPGIGIEIWFPTPGNWNGRIHNIGGLGGYDGGNHGSDSQVGWFHAAVHAGVEGAVSASTDAGHSSTNGSWGMNPDGSLATPLWVDFAHRAQHEMALKTRALTKAFYGRPARYCYYEGASTGGRHGYRLAQQYPDDYDGILASMPALNFCEVLSAWLYRSLVIQRDLNGVELTEGQMDLVSNAAIRSCDLVGGEHLGYIMDNAACRYDPTLDPDVLCVADGGNNTSVDAVTLAQARAINKIWYGPTSDGSVPAPAEDNGIAPVLRGNHLWYGLPRGTSLYGEYFARLGFQMTAHTGYMAGQVALQLGDAGIAEPTFINATGNGQGGWKDLSYRDLARAMARGKALEAEFGHIASDNPDLSGFKSRGGKLLSWHGWNDEAIPAQRTIQYYDEVIERMGGLDRVRSFFKLYLVPGGGHMSPHGTSNPKANPPAIMPGQFYALLVDWVEKGVEPGRVEIVSPTDEPVRRTAPIYPYPQKAVHSEGNPNVASSYIAG